MADFKYDNYEEQFDEENPSNLVNNNQQKALSGQNQPETFKVLVKQNRTQNKQSGDNISSHKNNSRMSIQTGSTKNKMIDQHIKLKSQLQELAEKMDEIVDKQRERRRKKNNQQSVQDDERVQAVKEELKQQQIKMNKHKAQIARLRRNMDSKYDLNKIVDKENQLIHVKKQLEALQQEQQSLEKIRKTQNKAVKINEDKESLNKKYRMEEQLKQVTQRTKKQTENINEKQKHVRKLHENFIIKEAKLKQYELKLKEKKPINIGISQSDINQLENELKQLEQQKLVIERQGNQKIRNLQRQKRQLKNQLDRRKLIFEQKQKQLRLNQMKHKQIVRLINSSQNTHHPNASVADSRVQKQNKTQVKRTIAKSGRQAPKIQADYDEEFQEPEEAIVDKMDQKQKDKKSAVEKHDYGFSANLDDDDDIIAEV